MQNFILELNFKHTDYTVIDTFLKVLEIFREFFGGLDPFEEFAFDLMGGRNHRNRVHRHRHRHSHNHDNQNRNSDHVHNTSAEAAGSAGGSRRCRRGHRLREDAHSQSTLSTLDPFSSIQGIHNFYLIEPL